jgi:secreted trypsin-like serine protease
VGTTRRFVALACAALFLVAGCTTVAASGGHRQEGPADTDNDTFRALVVGGKAAKLNTFPFLVSVLAPASDPDGLGPLTPADQDPRDRHVCGGTLLATKVVLTAAHCVFDTALADPGAQAHVGHPTLVNPGAQRSDIASAVLIGDYLMNGGNSYDVALVFLATPVQLRLGTELVRVAERDDPIAKQHKGWVAGWGSVLERAVSDPSSLFNTGPTQRARFAKVPIHSDTYCENQYEQIDPDLPVLEFDVCAGKAGKSTCQGDSGGPLVTKDHDGEFVQIGVTSRAPGCATDIPTLFTDVSKFRGWIEDNTFAPSCAVRISPPTALPVYACGTVF